MKKFIAILFIVIFPVISMAHIGHYNKYNKIEMEIFRNGELIGYNYYFFERNGEETIITNQFKFSVDLLGATIFQVESYGEEKYIKEDKIGKYPNHYYAKFKDGKITEVWKLTCNVVLDILLPKIKKQFDQGTSHKKDPRIGVSVSQKEIKEYGERIR